MFVAEDIILYLFDVSSNPFQNLLPSSWLLHLQKPHILRRLMKKNPKVASFLPKSESNIINTQLPFYYHQSMQTSITSTGLFCAGLKDLSPQDWADPLQAASLSINGSNLINARHFGVWKESQTGNLEAWKHDGSKCERENMQIMIIAFLLKI